LREGCLLAAGERMQRTIARIRPLTLAFAAVVASILVSLVILQPPAGQVLPGAAPADRGHVRALVLPAPPVSRPAARPQSAAAPVAAVAFVSTGQALRPPAAAASPTHRKPTPKPAPTPKPKPAAPTPPPPAAPAPAAPVPAPPQPQPVALARRGHGPPAHSRSRLLAAPKPKPAHHGPPHGKSPLHGPPPGHGKPKPPPPPPLPLPPLAPAPVQPTPPHGHAGAPPGQTKDKGSPHH
jgi:hypothetical protein